MLRILMIAYTTFSRDARVKRHADALAARGDHVDAICLEEPCPLARRSGEPVRHPDCALSRRQSRSLSRQHPPDQRAMEQMVLEFLST